MPGRATDAADWQPGTDVFLSQEMCSVVGTPLVRWVIRVPALAGQSDEAQTLAGPDLITSRTPSLAPMSKAHVCADVETTVASKFGRTPEP